MTLSTDEARPPWLRYPPQAPSQAAWDALSAAERATVREALPAHIPEEELMPTEGDPHLEARVLSREMLQDYFARLGRTVYVGTELAVYYPEEPRFSPDLFVVLGAAPGPRMKWFVSDEGRGLDLALEVTHHGDRVKDQKRNVERYARLGVREYFVFDQRRKRLQGWRLSDPAIRIYQPILSVGGRLPSQVLELELGLQDGALRFWHATAQLLTARERMARLEHHADELEARAEEAELRLEEAAAEVALEKARATQERERAEQERERAEQAEARLRALEAELAALRRG